MVSRARVRLGWTFALPLAAAALGRIVQVPGVEAIENPFGPGPKVGVLALGVLPFVTAFVLVELAALLVPALARLRLEAEGRAKLNRASRGLGVLLASAQAFGMALSLRTLTEGPLVGGSEGVSVPVVTATLVGGACACFVAAEHVTRQRLVNGPVLFLAATGLADLGDTLREAATRARMLGDLTPASVLGSVALLAAPCVATWYLLTRRSRGPSHEAPHGGPFREAPLAVGTSRWLASPLGSLVAFAIGSRLLAIPVSLSALGGGAAVLERSPWLYEALRLVVCSAVAVTIGRRLGPADAEAALARRLGVPLAPEAEGIRREELVRTMAYFALLGGATVLTGARGPSVPVVTLALVTAVTLDLWRGVRASSLVPVADERAPFAPRLIEAALAARGVEATTTGGAALQLLQGFTPFGGATVHVAEADADRARDALGSAGD